MDGRTDYAAHQKVRKKEERWGGEGRGEGGGEGGERGEGRGLMGEGEKGEDKDIEKVLDQCDSKTEKIAHATYKQK